MADYDGNIDLSVNLQVKDVTDKAKELQKTLQQTLSGLGQDKLTPELNKLKTTMEKTGDVVNKTIEEIQKLSNQRLAFEDYQATKAAVESYRNKLLEAYEAKKKLSEQHVPIKSDEWKASEKNIKHLRQMYDYLKTEMEQMEASGANLYTPQMESQLQSYLSDLEQLNNNIRKANDAFESVSNSSQKTTSRFQRLVTAVTSVGSVIGRRVVPEIARLSLRLSGLTGIMDRVRTRLGQLASRFTRTGNAANRFGNTFGSTIKKILSYGIGIASIATLFNKVRKAISDGITSMAKMNGGVNQTNVLMTQLTSSLNMLKGALAAAFQPILTVVGPILSGFMQQLANAINAIGMFIARLTGAKSYMKATFKSTDYAASQSSGGSSGKSAQEKYEAKVKEVEAKNAERMAKAEEKQAKAADKLAKKQEKANRKLADFDDLNVLGIETLEELEDVEVDLLDMPSLEDFLGSGGGGAGDPFGLEEVPIEDWEWNWDELLAKARELGERLAEFLNEVFADEALAQKIGNTIGNLINMAINFAYGFVSKFDFKQFGRWLGTLLREAIETIDWELLGTTLALGLNGLADTVIGFFETYPVGTLGQKISDMLNKAIHLVDGAALGQATLDVLQAPLIELRTVLTETHWRELGQKVHEWFKNVFSKEGLKGERLGQTIGSTLAAAVNSGVAFLLGLRPATVINGIRIFFEDVFKSALKGIDWWDVISVIFGSGGIVDGLYTQWQILERTVTYWILEGVATLLDKIVEALGPYGEALIAPILGPTADGLHTLAESTIQDVNLMKDGTITAFDEITGVAEDFKAQIERVGDGFTFSKDRLQEFYESGRFTSEQIDALIKGMQDFATESGTSLDLAKLGLDGYNGSWESFITRQEVRNELIKNGLDSQAKKVEETAGTTEKSFTRMTSASDIFAAKTQLDLQGATTNVNDYSTNANTKLGEVQTKSEETATTLEDVSTSINESLTTIDTSISEWYNALIEEYFSYDTWLTLMTEGPLAAIAEYFTQMMTNWDTSMQDWWDNHVKNWFTADKWTSEIWTPWHTALKTWWTGTLMTWWKTETEAWWKKVQDLFKQTKWEEEFNKIKKAAETVCPKIQEKLKGYTDESKEYILTAIEEIKTALQEILDMIDKAATGLNSVGSGSGGSGTSGGTKSGGGSSSGGGGTRGFMPMLDIMHFEDNLGMSAFKFPELATGAVIPPNREFLAVLGDQRNGMNIETPLATMVEAFRSVMDEYMGGTHQGAIMEVDGETFARLMMPYAMNEMNRLGYNTEIIEGT